MNEIICPNCTKAFKVDAAGFAEILKQVRDQDFKNELKNQLNLLEDSKNKDIAIAEAKLKNSLKDDFAEQKQIINELKSQIEKEEIKKELEISKAVKIIEKERDDLKSDLKLKESEKKIHEQSIEKKHITLLGFKDEEIAALKDFKQKISTKMVGETLEQHCEIEFNKLRATGFQNAYFEKDNDSKDGTKGDYIYKENDTNGVEIISIMFEMKNENDQTVIKKKNADFFEKLNKDREEKNCEYAVLVSRLEKENELYEGIVDVSHKFNKMYVVRPQFFIPIITLLRNAALNSMEYKSELHLIRNQNLDITNFEDKIEEFKTGFAKNYKSAIDNFQKAIDQIDKSIKNLENTKSSLLTSANQVRLANDKADNLSIKKLTRGNQTMKDKFNSVHDNK
jgi:hypothetical protein